MSFKASLQSWDGKSKDDIQSIFERFCGSSNFVKELIDALEQEECQSGASWLLKRWLEAGNTLTVKQIKTVFTAFAYAKNWQTKLHLLQSLPYLPFVHADEKYLHAFLRKHISDDNKFVRAWSYNALHLLSLTHSKYKSEVEELIQLAMKDEAASVKARLRNLLK